MTDILLIIPLAVVILALIALSVCGMWEENPILVIVIFAIAISVGLASQSGLMQ
jgi:hypothetical protein